MFAFLLGVFALSFFSTDEEGAAGWFGGGHDAKKGSNPLGEFSFMKKPSPDIELRPSNFERYVELGLKLNSLSLSPFLFHERASVPSPHSHFLNVASLPSHSLTSSISNPSHRLIIVGDIHGSIAPLKKLLKKLNYQPKKDVLLHVGDTVAKGPDPLEVLALLRKYEVMGCVRSFFFSQFCGLGEVHWRRRVARGLKPSVADPFVFLSFARLCFVYRVRGNHDQPVIEWRSWMEHVLPGGWPFAELDEWSESYARKKAGYLPMDGEKFKWQGEHFEIAR